VGNTWRIGLLADLLETVSIELCNGGMGGFRNFKRVKTARQLEAAKSKRLKAGSLKERLELFLPRDAYA